MPISKTNRWFFPVFFGGLIFLFWWWITPEEFEEGRFLIALFMGLLGFFGSLDE